MAGRGRGPGRSELWRAELESGTTSSPVLGCLDEDLVPDAVIGTELGDCRAYSGVDGHLLWSRVTGDRVSGRPAIGLLPGGAGKLVVAGSCDGLVHAWDGAGSRLWMYGAGSPVDWSSPALRDIDHDGFLDVLVGDQTGRLHAISGATSLARTTR